MQRNWNYHLLLMHDSGKIWQFLKIVNIEFYHTTAIPLLHIYPRQLKTGSHKDTYTNVNSSVIQNG